MDAHYRKLNDRSRNSSTYHKKDGTPVRAILKAELDREARQRDWEADAEKSAYEAQF